MGQPVGLGTNSKTVVIRRVFACTALANFSQHFLHSLSRSVNVRELQSPAVYVFVSGQRIQSLGSTGTQNSIGTLGADVEGFPVFCECRA